jgi:hypothetical protein
VGPEDPALAANTIDDADSNTVQLARTRLYQLIQHPSTFGLRELMFAGT